MPLELTRTVEEAREHLSSHLRNETVDDARIREHVRIVAGPQPYDHCHFAADQFFQFDATSGAASNIHGQRLLRVTDNFLRSLSRALNDELGERAPETLYRIGRRWGDADVKAFVPRIEQEYGCAFDKLGMGAMLESWWWPLRASGWGVWRYDFSHSRNGLVLVELRDSAAAQAAGKTGKPACHLYAGLFAAVFGFLARRELVCAELECVAKGDSQCRFLVATQRRIEVAVSHRDAGATTDEIVRKISSLSQS
jgi:predicted hydrocarbon binding protein